MQDPEVILDNKEITIVQFKRTDGVDWPFSIRMTLRYATNQSSLNAKQTHHLQWMAAVCQQGDRIVETYGLADRAGANNYNLALSKQRLTTMIHRLQSFGVPRDKFTSALTRALGESFPESFGKKDGARNAQDRAVVIFAWVNVTDFIGIGSSLAVCKFGRAGGGIAVL